MESTPTKSFLENYSEDRETLEEIEEQGIRVEDLPHLLSNDTAAKLVMPTADGNLSYGGFLGKSSETVAPEEGPGSLIDHGNERVAVREGKIKGMKEFYDYLTTFEKPSDGVDKAGILAEHWAWKAGWPLHSARRTEKQRLHEFKRYVEEKDIEGYSVEVLPDEEYRQLLEEDSGEEAPA